MSEAQASLVFLMMVAGVVGGLTNYLVGGGAEPGVSERSRLFSNLLVSAIAAFTTPLFLSLAKSSLISNLVDQYGPNQPFGPDIFVFFGFCLIASFSAKIFVRNLTDTVLNLKKDQRNLRSEVNDFGRDVEELSGEIEGEAEGVALDEPLQDQAALLAPLKVKLEPLQFHMLKALQSRPFTWRSVAGVRNEVGLSRDSAARILEALEARQLVDSKSSKASNKLYRITAPGRAALGLPPLRLPNDD